MSARKRPPSRKRKGLKVPPIHAQIDAARALITIIRDHHAEANHVLSIIDAGLADIVKQLAAKGSQA